MTSQLSPAADGSNNISTGNFSLPSLLTVDVSQQRRGSVGALWRSSRDSPIHSDSSVSEALLLVTDKARHRSGSQTSELALTGGWNKNASSAAGQGARKESLRSEADTSYSGGSHGGEDVVDGRSSLTDPSRLKGDIDLLKSKVQSTLEQIQQEQSANAENVTWYLSQSEASPSNRVKATFEKHNQKSVNTIAHLQKKLESYRQKLRDMEQRLTVAATTAAAAAASTASLQQQQQLKPAASHSNGRVGPKGMLRDVGTGLREIRDGVLGSLALVPIDFRRGVKKVFGSADNLLHLTKNEASDNNQGTRSTAGSGSGHADTRLASAYAEDRSSNDEDSQLRRSASSGQQLAYRRQQHQLADDMVAADAFLQKTKEHLIHVSDELHALKIRLDDMQDEVMPLQATLSQYHYRCQRFEEQMNDMSDLYQSELANLKLELANAQEKLEYKMDERSRDLQEEIENCHTKISKMELQGQRQQQTLNMEGVNNATARVLFTKLANIALFLAAVLLLVTSTLYKIAYPFFNSRRKSAAVFIAILAIILASHYWSSATGLLGTTAPTSHRTI